MLHLFLFNLVPVFTLLRNSRLGFHIIFPSIHSGIPIVSLEYIQKYSSRVLFRKQLSVTFYIYMKAIHIGLKYFQQYWVFLEGSQDMSDEGHWPSALSWREKHSSILSTMTTWLRSTFCLKWKTKPELGGTLTFPNTFLQSHHPSDVSMFYTIFQTNDFSAHIWILAEPENSSLDSCTCQKVLSCSLISLAFIWKYFNTSSTW